MFWLQLIGGVALLVVGIAWLAKIGGYALQPAVIVCVGLMVMPIGAIAFVGGLAMFSLGVYSLVMYHKLPLDLAIGIVLVLLGVMTMAERSKRLSRGG
jgi:hypothetical protein